MLFSENIKLFNLSPNKKERQSTPNFGPRIVAKRLDRSIFHLVRRWASVHATLCYIGTHLPHKKVDQSLP